MGIAHHADDGNRPIENPAQVRLAKARSRRSHLGHDGRGHGEELAQLRIPAQCVDVEQQCPASIGVVSGVHLAPGQLPDQPGIRGAGRETPRRGRGTRAVDVVEHPLELAGREVGIDDQAGLGPHGRLAPALAQLAAGVAATLALPDHGVVDRLAGLAVPDDRGLPLVGDGQSRDVCSRDAALLDESPYGLQRLVVDLLRVVLDPSRPRVDLLVALVGPPHHPARPIEENRLGRRRALIDGQNEFLCHGFSPFHERRVLESYGRLGVGVRDQVLAATSLCMLDHEP